MSVFQEQNQRGNTVWTNAFSATMGDGIVLRTAAGSTPAPRRTWWPWGRKNSATPAQH